jgi:transglutaminase-like putative cysteine protease
MLPAADSIAEVETLLQIGAAHPAVNAAGQQQRNPEDSEFLVDARSAAQAASRPVGDLEELADIRIDHLRKDSLGRDGLTSAHVQQLWRVNTKDGAESFSSHSVTYAAMTETLCIVRARVLKRDGREVAAGVSADQPVVARDSSMYFDSRRRELRFARLEPGDLVEVEYYLMPTAEVNPWGGYYARLDIFRDQLPTQLRRRVVIAPDSMKLYAVHQGLSPAVVRQTGGQTTRIWEMRDIAVQLPDSGTGERGPYLHVSTIGSAEEFGRWYSKLLEPGLELNERLRALATEILQRNLDTLGKVQAVYEVVQRSTKYVAFEFGVHSYKPYSVSTVERRGFGDCKDKAALMVALLRAVGVQAEFAMVRTRSAGAMAEQAYSAQLFNHAVAYVPALDLYLDGTAKSAALGFLPPNDLGAMAMTVDAEGRATRRVMPFTSTDATQLARRAPAAGAASVAANQVVKPPSAVPAQNNLRASVELAPKNFGPALAASKSEPLSGN